MTSYRNKNYRYFLVNKPYGVLSQFTDKEGRRTLKSIYSFPNDVYSVGRLDMDSEGLLIITNDKLLNDILLNPRSKTEKEYYVQVEGIPDTNALENLRNGVIIEGRKTMPAKVKKIGEPGFTERIPPIRERKNIPVSWLSISICEGRNRQIRKMTAAVGFPTLRLVRVRIKNLTIGKMNSGDVKELSQNEIEELWK